MPTIDRKGRVDRDVMEMPQRFVALFGEKLKLFEEGVFSTTDTTRLLKETTKHQKMSIIIKLSLAIGYG